MKNLIELKLNKRTIINALLVIALLAVVMETVELGLLSYALKTGALCK